MNRAPISILSRGPLLATALATTLATVFGSVSGCQRAFDAQSQIESLRVIAVRMDQSLPAPGSDVTIEMLVWDGSLAALQKDGTPRPIEIAWLGGCFDPKADLYYACYQGLAPAQAALDAGAPSPLVSRATTFTLHIADDVISRKSTTGAPPYGLSFVFYGVCAGKIVSVATNSASTPPLACIGYDGKPAVADGFVYGYLPIYSYPGVANQNPIVNGGTFDGSVHTKTCAGDGDCGAQEACGTSKLCLPIVTHCASDSPCVDHDIKPTVDVAASTEPNPISSLIAKEARNELLYVQYATNHGTMGSDTRTIVDVRAPHDDYDTNWHPPDTAVGETRIWAIVHDDRGGVTWWWQDVVVR